MAWIGSRALGRWVLWTRGEELCDAEITLGRGCKKVVFGVIVCMEV